MEGTLPRVKHVSLQVELTLIQQAYDCNSSIALQMPQTFVSDKPSFLKYGRHPKTPSNVSTVEVRRSRSVRKNI